MSEKKKSVNVNVKVNIDVDLTDISLIQEGNEYKPDVEQIAYSIQQYLIDGGDYEFSYTIED